MQVKHLAPLVVLLSGLASSASAAPITLSFTVDDIKSVMLASGDALHDDTYQWGLWSIRATPIVDGGGYDILDATVSSSDWWSARPSSGEYTPADQEIAFFYAEPGSEHAGVASHPLEFIADQSASTFQSYAFDGAGSFTGVCTDAPSTPGCNVASLLPDLTVFSFTFDLLGNGSWLGWQFLVDGTKYYRPSSDAPDNRWVMDFLGGNAGLPGQTEPGGGLSQNVGDGYTVLREPPVPVPVPEPGTLTLAALGLLAAGARRRRHA